MKLILAATLAFIGAATPSYAATSSTTVEGATNGSAKVDLTGWQAQSESGTIAMSRIKNSTPAGTGVELKRDGGTGTWAYALSPLKSSFFAVGKTYRMTAWVRDTAGPGRKYGILVSNGTKTNRPSTAGEYVSPTNKSWTKVTRTFTATSAGAADTALYLDLPATGSFKVQVAGLSLKQITPVAPVKAKTGAVPKAVGFANWNYDLGAGGWGNGELQTYTNTNSTIDPTTGKLKITVNKTGASTFTSARLNSQGKFEVLPGSYVEATVTAPTGSGIWPAFWLMGANKAKVGWPACGELDVFEGTGSKPTIAQQAAHMATRASATVDKQYGWTEPGGTTDLGAALDAGPHKFGVYFDAKTVRFYIDRQPTMSLFATDALESGRTWPFAKKMFMIVNVAISPSYSTASTVFPKTMTVDPISVYRGLPF